MKKWFVVVLLLGVALIAADTQEAADRLASSADLHFVRRAMGEFAPLASPEEAAAYAYTAVDRKRIEANRRRLMVGTPASLHERLTTLVASTKADEVMITTMVYDHAARRRSYELMAEAFGLAPAD